MTNRPSPELDAFEQRLLAELRTVVDVQAAAARPAPPVRSRHRAQRFWYVPVAGAAVAVVAVALIATAVRPSPAYAVSGGNGKQVTVKVNRLEGPEGLQQALREHGITADITYLPSDKACQPGRYTELDTPGLSLSVGANRFEVKIPPGAVGPGDTFVLSAAVKPLDNGVQAIVEFGITDGPIAPCTMVDAS